MTVGKVVDGDGDGDGETFCFACMTEALAWGVFSTCVCCKTGHVCLIGAAFSLLLPLLLLLPLQPLPLPSEGLCYTLTA